MLAVFEEESAPDDTAPPSVQRCQRCFQDTVGAFYRVDEQPFCAACKGAFTSEAFGVGSRPFLRAASIGIVVSIALIVGTYALMFALERIVIGIEAPIAYALGDVVRRSARHHGGRSYQLLAIGLASLVVLILQGPYYLTHADPTWVFSALFLLVGLTVAWYRNREPLISGPSTQ